MAGHGDLQELLRMFTARKISMMASMKHVQALQAKNLKTIDQIAEAPLTDLESVLSDPKLAKSVHTACKSHVKKGKRPADDSASPPTKKPKLEPHKRDLDYGSMSPDELEASLALPLVEDEETIRQTTLVTNRAPLVLAFAVELLRFTMPEQPLSSRLSLAQAVVSANSKTKAISLGIEKAPPGGEGAGISDAQPKLRVMGREVPVLKRGGYSWSGGMTPASSTASSATIQASPQPPQIWRAGQRVTSRSSTFIAHAAPLSSPSLRSELMKTLMTQKPELETATHNAWAVRTSYGNSPLVQEASFDDGESGCGKFMLELMRAANITNMVVVLTRWYGGVMLGPDRWRLMRECINDALSAQRRTATLSGEAVWALDPGDTKPASSTVGMAIHRPEGARNYLLRSFATAGGSDEKKSTAAANEERQENLGCLLGALRLLFASWADILKSDELDRRAWSCYVQVRPEVESGPAGWGAKGTLDLGKILDLRRKKPTPEGSGNNQ
ncbi:hypothetical protein ACO1O0_001848 [Amphichorda felina]